MRLKRTHCPNCNGMLDLQVEDHCSKVFCPYCGQVYEVDHRRRELVINQEVNVTNRYINDAEIIRAKTKDRESRRWWIPYLVIFAIPLFAFAYLIFEPRVSEFIAQNQGRVRAGDYWDYDDLNYQAAEQYLRELGFTNIVLIDLDDAVEKNRTDGEVESVTIDGDSGFYDDDYFYPTDKVIIRYH